MSWNVYAVGDVAFLVATMEATAAIFGEDGFQTLAYIGAMLGFIWLLVKSITEGAREINIGAYFAALIMFFAFFTIKTDVKVHDARNVVAPAPPAVTVTGVPMGLAASSSLLSQIGKTLSDWFVREYTMPSAHGQASAFALQVLFEMRQLGMADGSLNWDPDGKIQRSLDNYVKDCVIPGTILLDVSTGAPVIDAAALGSAPNPWELMHFPNNLYRVEVHLTSGTAPIVQSCNDAYNTIDTQWFAAGSTGTAFRDRIIDEATRTTCQSQNHACNNYFVKDATGDYSLQASTREMVAQGIQAILGIDVNLDRLLISRAVTGAIERAGSVANAGQGDLLMSTVLSKASAAMTSGQALEMGMFERTMLPLMTFFEALMFIAAPFAAFALTLGMVGIGLLAKYLVFALWIQLWQPVLAAINMYIYMAATGSMKAMQDFRADGANITALQSQPQLFDEVAHWVGTGSMLAAATPAITLMLIYGSAVTASSLASRIDAPKNSEVGMDTLKGESSSGESYSRINQHGGVSEGVNQTADMTGPGALNLSAGVGVAQSNARQEAQTAMRSAALAQTNTATATWSGINQLANTQSSAVTEAMGEGWTTQFTDSLRESLGESHAISQGEMDNIQTALKAGAAMGFDMSEMGGALAKTLSKPNQEKLKGIMSSGPGAVAAFMGQLLPRIEAGVDMNETFAQTFKETSDLRAAAEKAWSSSDGHGYSLDKKAQTVSQDQDSSTTAFQRAEQYAEQYTENKQRASQASSIAQKLDSFQASTAITNSLDLPTVLSQMRHPENLQTFRDHVAAMQKRDDKPAFYANIDAGQATAGDYLNTLRAANYSGNVGETAELLRMAGFSTMAEHLGGVPRLTQVGYAAGTHRPEMPNHNVQIGDNSINADAPLNRADQSGVSTQHQNQTGPETNVRKLAETANIATGYQPQTVSHEGSGVPLFDQVHTHNDDSDNPLASSTSGIARGTHGFMSSGVARAIEWLDGKGSAAVVGAAVGVSASLARSAAQASVRAAGQGVVGAVAGSGLRAMGRAALGGAAGMIAGLGYASFEISRTVRDHNTEQELLSGFKDGSLDKDNLTRSQQRVLGSAIENGIKIEGQVMNEYQKDLQQNGGEFSGEVFQQRLEQRLANDNQITNLERFAILSGDILAGTDYGRQAAESVYQEHQRRAQQNVMFDVFGFADPQQVHQYTRQTFQEVKANISWGREPDHNLTGHRALVWQHREALMAVGFGARMTPEDREWFAGLGSENSGAQRARR